MSGNVRDTSSTASGSRTTLVTQNDVPAQTDGLLRLRASSASNVESRRVIWSEDTVDNEHLGKKKSKICCIYHKPKEFDESSDESSSSSSDGDSDCSSGSCSSKGGQAGAHASKSNKQRRRLAGQKQRKDASGEACSGPRDDEKRRRRERLTQSSTTAIEQLETPVRDMGQGADEGREVVRAANAYERG